MQHDAELAAQVLHVQFANVDAVEQNLAALDFVKAQQELDRGGFAGAGVADDGDGLPRLDVEGDVAQHPVFVAWDCRRRCRRTRHCGIQFRRAYLAEPAPAVVGSGRQRLVEELEDAFGSGHGRLQDIEFFAQVLNGLEEALRVLHEGDEHADRHRAGERPQAAVPEHGDDGQNAQKFDAGIEQREGQNGVFVRLHVHAVQFGKLFARFLLAVEKLHHAHAADVFLQERVDARDGRADAAVGVAHPVAENPGGQER